MSLLKLIHKALSDSDIRKILGHSTKIIKYSEHELLPNPTDYCIILYEDSIDHGHWVGLSRYDGKYEHFNSYGLKPDKELAWVNFKVRRSSGETQPFLSELLKHKEYVYNDVRYQASEADVVALMWFTGCIASRIRTWTWTTTTTSCKDSRTTSILLTI